MPLQKLLGQTFVTLQTHRSLANGELPQSKIGNNLKLVVSPSCHEGARQPIPLGWKFSRWRSKGPHQFALYLVSAAATQPDTPLFRPLSTGGNSPNAYT